MITLIVKLKMLLTSNPVKSKRGLRSRETICTQLERERERERIYTLDREKRDSLSLVQLLA